MAERGDRVACLLCEKVFSGPEAIEKLERHEARAHPTEPPAPLDDFQARENEATLAARAATSSLRADLETLAATLERVEALAADLGRRDLERWAGKNKDDAARWARRI